MTTGFRFRSVFAGVLTALLGIGCMSSGPSGSVSGALTSGRVSSEGGASSGVSVRAYGVAPDGSMSPASDAAMTGADGRYTLHVTLATSATRLVVRAEDGTDRMASLGRASIATTGSAMIVLPPINTNSSLMTSVDLALEGMQDVSLEESASTSLFLSPDASARLAAGTSMAASVQAAAHAVAAARATFAHGLDPSVAGSGDAHLAFTGIATEEARLAGRLDAATTPAAIDAAYTAYLSAVVSSTVDAGYSHEAVATAALSAESALDLGIGDRMSAGHAELRELSGFAVTSAVDAGAGSSLGSTVVTSASATLRASLVSMASAGASAEAMTAAWTTYQTTVDAEVATHGTLTAALLTTLEADVTTSTAALQTALVTVGASGTASARVQAFTDYRASVDSSAHTTLLTTGGLDATQAHAVLDAMADISAAAP